jgi:hypothetical protein
MQIGALVIGIEDYANPEYRQSQFRLQYAVEDAKAFVRYLTTAWQDHVLHICCLENGQATQEAVLAAVVRLAEQSIDILFVYLSGHGDKDSQSNGWFCLVDAVPGERSFDGTLIDTVFLRVGARTSLLLLDCCYAESVLSNSRFFASLQNAHSRLFICSSRADQQTWEDDGVRHGIFSNILLRGLSTVSPVANPSGLVDIEGGLFRYLCEQVPLAVVAAKGAGRRQEPVKGGISSGPIEVPTVSASLLGRQLSTYDAVLLGTRRWLGRIAAIALLALITIQLAFYHLAIGPTGEIEVRPGLKATEVFTVFGKPIETGITQAALATGEDDPSGKLRTQLVSLAERRLWGISLQRQPDGLKGWFGQLLPMLRRSDRAELVVLATGRLPADYTGADPETEKPPFLTILEAALLAGDKGTNEPTPFRFDYDLPSAAELDCDKTVANIRDFSLMQPTSSVLAADLSWNAARAVLQPSSAIGAVLDASKVVAYRIAQAGQMDSHYIPDKEASALSAALLAVRKIAMPTAKSAVPHTAPESWCEPGFAVAKMFLGGSEDSRHAAITLAGYVSPIAAAVNDRIVQARSEAALGALQVLAKTAEIPVEAVSTIMDIVEKNDRGLDGEPVISEWLRSVASRQSFSPHDTEWLFSQLNQSAENFNFSPLTAFDILSRTVAHLDSRQRKLLAGWYSEHFADYRTQSVFAEATGYLGAVVPISPDPISFLSDRLVPEIHISGRNRTRRGTQIVRSTDFEAGLGLGVLGKAQKLPADVVEKLYLFAMARGNLGELSAVYEGLAAQRSVTVEDLSSAVVSNLATTRSSRMRRETEIEIAIAQIVHREPKDRERVIGALERKWREEFEPDLRIALAQVIVRSKLRASDILLPVDSADSCDCEN